MKKVIHTIPFLRLTMALSAGIFLASVVYIPAWILYAGAGICSVSLLWINSRYRYNLSFAFGLGVHLFFAGTGVALYQIFNSVPEFGKGEYYFATVLEIPGEKAKSFQSVLEIDAVAVNDSVKPNKEKVMVWFEKNDYAASLKPGNTIVFGKHPQPVRNNNHPFEFDYKQYLTRRNIYRQVYLPSGSWSVYNRSPVARLPVLAERVRNSLLNIYGRQRWDERQFDVISALTLGYKHGLDPETKQIFASAGAMHVLAVSGLHVGILFFILTFLFGFLKKRQSGRFLFIALVIVSLWSFAFVSGMSPSVKRAATMFTFVLIGQSLRRQLNIYNTLAASAFFLLVFNPNNLFEAGFQLSYAAVFGIVFLQPKIECLMAFRNKIFRYSWSLLTVSVAAQVATFPVSVYYFNQFPLYFWISNLLVIPAVTVLIPLSILILALHWIPSVSMFLSLITGTILNLLFQFLELIESLPRSVIPIYFSSVEVCLVLAIVISVFFLIELREIVCLRYLLGFLLLYLITTFSIYTYNLFRKEVIVYNFSGQNVMHCIVGKRNYLISEEAVDNTPAIQAVINKTVLGLRLNPPVFLTGKDAFNDSVLYMKNGLIYFKGQVIELGSGAGTLIQSGSGNGKVRNQVNSTGNSRLIPAGAKVSGTRKGDFQALDVSYH